MEDISPRTVDRIRSRSQGRKTFGATTTASFYTARSSSPFVETNPIELTKKRTLKKILALASIDQEVMKILKRLLELGPRSLDEKAKLKLEEKAEDVMEEDKRSELEYYIGKISHEGDSSYKIILSMFKLFIVSSEERNYIERIDEELNRGLELEDEIQDANKNLIVQREKKGKSNAIQESAESLRKEIEQYENKIEKANQKLNQSIVHNEELRRKVDHLRRDRLLIDQVYQRLEKEMVEKQEEIEATIRNAGEAYLKKDRAEEELRHLNQRSEEQRETFFNDLKGINKSIDEERHFKEFIFHKNKGKKELETLEIAIVKNQKKIEEKMKMNAKMENEYNISAKKEEEIRKAFEKIQQGTGVHAPQDVVVVFNSLHQRMTEMERYVKELSSDVHGLDRKIFDLKDQLRSYSLKGVKHDKKNAEEAEALLKKMDAEEKKRRVYKVQYRKSIETLSEHKEKIEKLFAAIGAEEKLVTKIRNSTFTEQNISEFIGLLEEKGMTLINRFSRLIAQQIILEKGSTYNIESQLEDLNNIIAYNNANTMNQRPDKKPTADVPDDVFNAEAGVDKENPLTEEQFRQVAFSMLSSTQKRSLSPGVKRVHSGKLSKFNIRSSSASKQKKGSINAL